MLNCTDLACVLHHHHFYAHLHQLKHHLQDDNVNIAFSHERTENDSPLAVSNEAGGPSDIVYMIGGVLIAMLLVGCIIILVAVTINKLRKRDESSSSTASSSTNMTQRFSQNNSQSSSYCSTDHEKQQQLFTTNHHSVKFDDISSDQDQVVTFARTSGGPATTTTTTTNNNWVFPPTPPTPHIYNCINNDIQAANDKNGFRGFRKQFSGRFKRLVTKKPEATIPPELKPQLKTIYVY